MNKLRIVLFLPLFGLALTSFHSHAATVNAMFSWESADYDTSNNYSGYRVDFNINPDKSNWYFDVGFRQREHDNKNRYQRYDLQGSYRFKLNNGWIQPGLKIRQDLTNYDNGSRLTIDFYESKTNYQFPINKDWVLTGSVLFGLQKKEDKRSNGVTNTDYLGWEIEPGIRYFITPNINMTLSEKRAKNVIEMLKAKGVVADRIVIGYKGDTVQPYQKPEENRVCICIAE